jgi:hypothetical protein
MKIAFSIVILAAPILVYWFIIRPRLEARFVDTYANLNGFWARVWARVVAFRTFLIGAVGLYASEIPAALEMLQGTDLTFLPQHWQSTIRVVTIIAVMVSRAVATTPASEPEKP